MNNNLRSALLAFITITLFTAVPAFSFAESVTWTDTFIENQDPTPEQCSAWQNFLDQLDPNKEYVSATMKSTFDPEGITMTDPIAVQDLAYLLYSRTPGDIFSDGHTWSVYIGCNADSCVPRGEGVELRIDQENGCRCCFVENYTIRPDVGNYNWGGVNTQTCISPDQTVMVEFQIKTETIKTIIIDDCDSGVDNIQFSAGFSVNDQIAACGSNATNHGSFVSCVSDILNLLKQEGLVSGKEKGAIQKCAAKANIP